MILKLLFAGMVFAAATILGAAQAQSVRISYGGTSGYNVPVWVTQEAGLFKKYGLNAELIFISGAAPGMQAMLANEVHFANTSGSAPINATLQGTDAVIIATSYDLIPYGFVVHKDIHTPADLKGKIIAISRLGGVTELAARVTFEKLGLNPKDMTLIQAGPDAQRIPAVQSGNAAATVIAPPGLFAAVARGLRVLVDLTDLGIKYPTSVFFVTRSFLMQNRPAVKKFLMAFTDGLHLYAQRRDFVLQVMKKYTKLDDADVLTKSHDYFVKKTLLVPLTDAAAVKNALPMGKPVNRKLEDFYDNSIVQELISEGFVEKISNAYK
ncbi:MAG TPA: ABC transporter substrate-binding protein [Candidatus Binatia bacterium]|jgi:NitT/TauT family transport system substrate-binding protein|nr:ABC transporter substrate-binding protein [Candidatus Binatia bacterium]